MSTTDLFDDRSLVRHLENLTASFNKGGGSLDVELADASYAKDEDTIAISAALPQKLGVDDPAQALRLYTDTLSHEVYHVILSDLLSKKRFVEENDEYPHVAGAIIDVLEDTYVNNERFKDFPGLRSTRAFVTDRFIKTVPFVCDDRLERSEALLQGFKQVGYAGYARGISDADDDIKEFLARSRPIFEEYRDEHDVDRRYDLAQQAYDLYLDYAPDPEQGDEYADEQGFGPADEELDGDAEPSDADEQDGANGADGADSEESEDSEESSTQSSQPENGDGDDSDEQGTPDKPDKPVKPDNPDKLDDSDIRAIIDAMQKFEQDGDVKEWSDVPQSTDIGEPSDGDVEFAAMLAEPGDYSQSDSSESESDSSLEDTGRTGESRRSSGDRTEPESKRYFANATERYMFDKELEEDIRRAFEQFVTRERHIPSRHGHRVNVRNLIRLRAGDASVRELAFRQELAEPGDRLVCAVTDASVSVDDEIVKVALASCAIACETIGDDFIANAFSSRFNGNVKRIIEPGESFEYAHLDRFSSRGRTPTAHGLEDAQKMLRRERAREQVCIVITDGKANIALDIGGNATDDAALLASQLRQSGVKVIGIGVDDVDDDMMREIFGDRGYVRTDMDRLDDALIRVYRNQLSVSVATA